MINIYADGACSGNKRECGIGGYGYVIMDGKKQYKNGGAMMNTTNNIMELVAVIASLKEVYRIYGSNKSGLAVCTIYSDSKYVVDNWNGNLIKWIDRGWVTSKGINIVNRKYWELLFHMTCHFRMVKFIWVKGHDDNKNNETANDIAVSFSQKKRREIEKDKMQKEQEG